VIRTASIAALLLAALSVCGCSASSSTSHRASTHDQAGWPPHGSKIAFSRGAPNGGIYVMNPDGSRLTRMTTDPGDDQSAWSPGASEIAFDRFRHGSQDIYAMRADGRRLRRLTRDGASGGPTWSPDGAKIAFAREASRNADIYVMDGDGTRVTRLTRDPLLEYSPAWSPDGLRIAYVAYSKGPPSSSTRLYVMNANGSHRRTIGPDDAALPSWSPDGTEISFVKADNGSVYVIGPAGSGLRRVADVASLRGGRSFPPNFTSRPAWSPDGRRILFAAGKIGSSHLYLVDLDGSGLVRLTHGAVEDEDPAWSRAR
jgi:Tol biopolymer transport system component